ncbi:MAG: hypothetical protein V1661_00120 [bacterium]
MTENRPNINFDMHEPPAGLFDRIIFAIKRERELRKTKKILFGFFALLVISLFAVPVSGMMFMNQIKNSGAFYIISAAFRDIGMFAESWQDFGTAILESLPIAEIAILAISIFAAVFTLRLFLRRKKLLLGYLMQKLI